MPRPSYTPMPVRVAPAVPFDSSESVWFWFVQAQTARQDGARFVAGLSDLPRPCEPLDILRIVDRLYRQRRLMRDHLAVLAFYGRRLLAPDPRRPAEQRAQLIWREALDRLDPVLRGKGIVA
jgi:hypothetical protein